MIARTLNVAAPRAEARGRRLVLLSRPALVVVLVAAITTPFLLQPWVSSDGIGHYAYLRSMMFDHDLDFTNEFTHYDNVYKQYGPPNLEVIATSPSHPVNINPIIETPARTKTGLVWNPWPVGSSMLWAPFTLATWPIVETLRAFGRPVPNDGYSHPYMLAVGFGTVFYGVLGLILCLDVCLRYFSRTASLLAVLATWFGTTFVFYLFVMPSYAHVNSMFAVTWFVWYWHRRFHDTKVAPGGWSAFFLGVIGGLMTAVQWTNVTFLVTFGALGAWSVWTSSRTRAPIASLLRYGVLLTAGWLLAFSPQLAVNDVLYGGPLANPQPTGFFAGLSSPHILGVLFSSDRGLFFWTPLTLLCLAGLWFCTSEAGLLVGVLLLNFLLHLYINASVDGCAVPMSSPLTCHSAWAGDSAFGQRRFTNLTLLFALGLAALLQRPETTTGRAGRLLRALRVVVPAAFVVWNLLLVVQYALWTVPHTGTFTVAELVQGQLEALRKMGTVLTFLF